MFSFRVTATVKGLPLFRAFDYVGDALEQARAFLASGATNISILNNHGNHLEGSALEDCCRNAEGIQNDLTPVKLGA
jgi:hypothetical protein